VPALPDASKQPPLRVRWPTPNICCERLAAESEAVDSRWGRLACCVRGPISHLPEPMLPRQPSYFCSCRRVWGDLAAVGTCTSDAGCRIALRERTSSAGEVCLLDCQRVFDQAGARPLSRTAAAELARLGGRRREESLLTAAERVVLDLAAGGLRNTEIAARLHISPKTVENHLADLPQARTAWARRACCAETTGA